MVPVTHVGEVVGGSGGRAGRHRLMVIKDASRQGSLLPPLSVTSMMGLQIDVEEGDLWA